MATPNFLCLMAELVVKLAEQLGVEIVPAVEGKTDARKAVRPNLDRLTVGVDLGDQWSNYCILGLAAETLAEGRFRTRKQEVAEFFQVLAISRVVIEVGTHSAWVREIIAGFGHEVLVANPRADGWVETSPAQKRSNRCREAGALVEDRSEIPASAPQYRSP
jgi:hypothetical protein